MPRTQIRFSRKKVAKAIAQKSIPEVIVWEGENSSKHDGECAGKNIDFPAHSVHCPLMPQNVVKREIIKIRSTQFQLISLSLHFARSF